MSIKDMSTKDWKAVLFLNNGKAVYWLPKTNKFLLLEKNGLCLAKPTEEEVKEIFNSLVWEGEEE